MNSIPAPPGTCKLRRLARELIEVAASFNTDQGFRHATLISAAVVLKQMEGEAACRPAVPATEILDSSPLVGHPLATGSRYGYPAVWNQANRLDARAGEFNAAALAAEWSIPEAAGVATAAHDDREA